MDHRRSVWSSRACAIRDDENWGSAGSRISHDGIPRFGPLFHPGRDPFSVGRNAVQEMRGGQGLQSTAIFANAVQKFSFRIVSHEEGIPTGTKIRAPRFIRGEWPWSGSAVETGQPQWRVSVGVISDEDDSLTVARDVVLLHQDVRKQWNTLSGIQVHSPQRT